MLQSELVEESQSQSADYSWQITQKISSCIMVTDSDVLASGFDSIQSEEIKHVWYFQLILAHLFSLVMHASPSNKLRCDRNNFKIA